MSRFTSGRQGSSGQFPSPSATHDHSLIRALEAKCVTPRPWSRAERNQTLAILYSNLWGANPQIFDAPHGIGNGVMLSEHQARTNPDYGRDIPGVPCGRIFKKGECCYKCKDCALDDSCVLCSRCFHASEHEGHNVSFYLALQPGGCCDCGDQEAWGTDIKCRFHPIVPGRAITQAAIPDTLRHTISETISDAIDFVIETLDYSPEDMILPRSEYDLQKAPTGAPRQGNLSNNVDLTMPEGSYSIVLWNDEKHSYPEVQRHLRDSTNCSSEEAAATVKLLETEGRVVIETSHVWPRLAHVSQMLAQIDQCVTIRRHYDTFREQMAALVIEWLFDLTRCNIFGNDAVSLKEFVTTSMFEARNPDLAALPHSVRTFSDLTWTTRMEWLFLYHPRLWKRPRLTLKDLYMSMLTLSHAHRVAIGVQFAKRYNRIMDAYLLVDREAETSVKYFTVQLFTVPSVASFVVENYNMIGNLLGIIVAFFTNRISNKHIDVISMDELDSIPDLDINVDSFPFRSKRFMPVFSDLRYICSNASVQEIIARDRKYIEQFTRACRLFFGINPNKRAVSTHVEYETESWISVFNVTLSLSRVVKAYGESYSKGQTADLVAAIEIVYNEILMICTLTRPHLDPAKYNPIAFHTIQFRGVDYSIVDFDVLTGYVSFHHVLHWLMAELFKHVDILTGEQLSPLGFHTLRDVMIDQANDQGLLILMDFPLRVLAMVAQARTGLWVRNGFAIRGQLLHYRDYMLRELCYDQDLFLIQSCLIMLDPNLVLVSLLDRFQLSCWFAGAIDDTPYEGQPLAGMIEEFLYIIITILSERASASKMDTASVVRREIIHGLALGPCTYTDLCKRVAERVADDTSFDHTLSDVATFKPPKGVHDLGIFELRDVAFDEVDPYFFHYTRNRREEIESILKARLKRKTGVESPIIIPKPLKITSGPFSILSDVFQSEILLQIICYTILNSALSILKSETVPPSADVILDQGLHLLMLALIEQPESFSQLAARATIGESRMTIIRMLCRLEPSPKLASVKNKVQWCLGVLSAHVEAEVLSERQVETKPSTTESDTANAKKRAAKARQEAIMKQFASQQQIFLRNIEDEDVLEDDSMDAQEESVPSMGSCIVCQEALDANRAFGALCFVQPSRVMRRMPADKAHITEVLDLPPSLDREIPLRQPSNLPEPSFHGFPTHGTHFGLHNSLCGHLMHMDCLSVYTFSVEQRHAQQTQRNHPENIDRDEFICPLCKGLCNSILPVRDIDPRSGPSLNESGLQEWMRGVGIDLLRTPSDQTLERLQYTDGSGEYTFWSAEDSGYTAFAPNPLGQDETHRMIQTVMTAAQSISEQVGHFHERELVEGQRGAGLYLPEALVGYTLAAIEVGQRGLPSREATVAHTLNDFSLRLVRGNLDCLRKLAALQFADRPDGGETAIRQAILKRLLPEWTRDPTLRLPMLFRDPLTILIEIAAVAPDIFHHVTALMYYACLARTSIGLILLLAPMKETPPSSTAPEILGDIKTFVLSVTRHSPALEKSAEAALRTSSAVARFGRLLYSFTLPFLRRAAILSRAAVASPLQETSADVAEYERLLHALRIPPPTELDQYESLLGALTGWSSHYGKLHALSVMDCTLVLDFPGIHRFADLPRALDSLFANEKTLLCHRCNTVPVDAAICMLCGTVCCYQSHCCTDTENNNQGECNMHTRECSGVVGLYYCVKRCAMLYLYAGSGAVGPSPYLDVHGEVDFGMRRGRRQYLHAQRLEELRKVWLNHGIPTYVARKLDSGIDTGGWDSI